MALTTPINNTLPQHTYGLRSIHRLVDMIHRALARLSYHGMQRPSLPLTTTGDLPSVTVLSYEASHAGTVM